MADKEVTARDKCFGVDYSDSAYPQIVLYRDDDWDVEGPLTLRQARDQIIDRCREQKRHAQAIIEHTRRRSLSEIVQEARDREEEQA